MEYLVDFTLTVPDGTPPAEVAERTAVASLAEHPNDPALAPS